jgi:hypothetical protein
MAPPSPCLGPAHSLTLTPPSPSSLHLVSILDPIPRLVLLPPTNFFPTMKKNSVGLGAWPMW